MNSRYLVGARIRHRVDGARRARARATSWSTSRALAENAPGLPPGRQHGGVCGRRRSDRRADRVSDLHLARSLLLFAWAFGLGGVEVEIEGGYGWAERMPTWFLKRGTLGAVYGMVMGHRPLTGYHVYVFIMPLDHPEPALRLRRAVEPCGRADGVRHLLRACRGVGLHLVRAEPRLHRAPVPEGQRVVVRAAVDLALPARLLHGYRRSRSSWRRWRRGGPAAGRSALHATCGCSR